ncbi:Mpv17-like protein [Bagarius yarrelli]|uniref:Mpv17-like protein n=1 Tax=Bagarius yarrelli TaxID=175774 RepID=A0A556TTE9_BAGYA|nr:Mpv17-like protein [Bagarius yarrelli]
MRNPIRRYPWLTNVTLYSCLFAGGDLMQQYLSSKDNGKIDWKRTRNVAIVAFCFNGNFNFFWMRFLERKLPGKSVRAVLQKLAMDQTISLPLAISGFYTVPEFCLGAFVPANYLHWLLFFHLGYFPLLLWSAWRRDPKGCSVLDKPTKQQGEGTGIQREQMIL